MRGLVELSLAADEQQEQLFGCSCSFLANCSSPAPAFPASSVILSAIEPGISAHSISRDQPGKDRVWCTLLVEERRNCAQRRSNNTQKTGDFFIFCLTSPVKALYYVCFFPHLPYQCPIPRANRTGSGVGLLRGRADSVFCAAHSLPLSCTLLYNNKLTKLSTRSQQLFVIEK